MQRGRPGRAASFFPFARIWAKLEVKHGKDRNGVESSDIHEADLDSELRRELQAATDAKAKVCRAVVGTVLELAVVIDVYVRVEETQAAKRIRLQLPRRLERILGTTHYAEHVDREIEPTELRSDVAAMVREVRIASNGDWPIRAMPFAGAAKGDADVVRVVAARNARCQ